MPAVERMDSTPAATAKETSKSVGVLEELIKTLSVSKGQDEANAAAGNIATLLNGPIEERSVPAK
jgi:elongation factor 3